MTKHAVCLQGLQLNSTAREALKVVFSSRGNYVQVGAGLPGHCAVLCSRSSSSCTQANIFFEAYIMHSLSLLRDLAMSDCTPASAAHQPMRT